MRQLPFVTLPKQEEVYQGPYAAAQVQMGREEICACVYCEAKDGSELVVAGGGRSLRTSRKGLVTGF